MADPCRSDGSGTSWGLTYHKEQVTNRHRGLRRMEQYMHDRSYRLSRSLRITLECTILHISLVLRLCVVVVLGTMHDRAREPATWGKDLRSRRLELRLRQDELAALAGVSTRFVHALEQSKPTVRLDKVLAVLRQLGLDLVLEPGSGILHSGQG